MLFKRNLRTGILFSSFLLLASGIVGCQSLTGSNDIQGELISLKGAGATFPAPLYKRWIAEFIESQDGNVMIAYDSVGSSKGIESFLAQTVDFGATDAPIQEDERKKFPPDRVKPIQIPVTGGLVVLAYNLAGVENLQLSRSNYCGIATGQIKTWNDPRIATHNPDVNLPNLPILFVHHAGGSGTTFIFTNHLKAACPGWTGGASKSVQWPTGISAQGNEGVSAEIKQSDGAIGYIEYSVSQEKRLTVASLENNKSGRFIAPSPESGTTAFVGVKIPSDLALEIPDPPSAEAYPIVGLTWLLLYGQYNDETKVAALKRFIRWSLDDGKKYADEMGYIPLPSELQDKVLAVVDSL